MTMPRVSVSHLLFILIKNEHGSFFMCIVCGIYQWNNSCSCYFSLSLAQTQSFIDEPKWIRHKLFHLIWCAHIIFVSFVIWWSMVYQIFDIIFSLFFDRFVRYRARSVSSLWGHPSAWDGLTFLFIHKSFHMISRIGHVYRTWNRHCRCTATDFIHSFICFH